MTNRISLVFNALGFQLVWWASVLGVIFGQPLMGPIVLTIYLGVHLRLIRFSQSEVILLLAAGLLGTAIDTFFAATGAVRYSGGYENLHWLAPVWISAMWIGFSATINHSLKWLKNRPLVGFIMGAIFGPLAYHTGTRFDVVQVSDQPLLSWVTLALAWGLAIPTLYYISQRLQRRES